MFFIVYFQRLYGCYMYAKSINMNSDFDLDMLYITFSTCPPGSMILFRNSRIKLYYYTLCEVLAQS